MTKALIRTTGGSSEHSLFPQKVKLIKTDEICENLGYYGNLFTLRLPNGRLAEVHRRELDVDTRVYIQSEWPVQPKSKGR